MKFTCLFISLFFTLFNSYGQEKVTLKKSESYENSSDSLILEMQNYKHFMAKIPNDTINYDKIEKTIFYVDYNKIETFKDSIQALLKKNYPTLFVMDYSKGRSIILTDILKIYRFFSEQYQKNPSHNCKIFAPNYFKRFEEQIMDNNGDNNKIIIRITKKGHFYIENEEVNLKALKLKLKSFRDSYSLKSVIIAAETGTPFKKLQT